MDVPAKKQRKTYADWLFEPVHSSSLGLFRILLAANLILQNDKFRPVFTQLYASYATFQYSGFWWYKAPTAAQIEELLFINKIALCFLLVGCGTKVAATINFITFFLIFHICESYFNNHYVLVCQIAAVSIFVEMGRWLSVDTAVRNTLLRRQGKPLLSVYIPRYHLFLMQVMMVIPYVGGAIAKINWDWLGRCEPPITWFGARGGFPYNVPGYPCFVAWGGFLFDAVIGFIIFHPRLRYYIGIPGVAFFNCMNKFMFEIGIFPILMLCSLLLFFDEDLPQKALNLAASPIVKRLRKGQDASNRAIASATTSALSVATSTGTEEALQKDSETMKEEVSKQRREFQASTGLKKKCILWCIAAFFVIHIVWPLRYVVVYDGEPSWSEEGHFASWHMMLRHKTGPVTLHLKAKGPKGRTVYFAVSPQDDPYLTRMQSFKVEGRPHATLLYTKLLARIMNEADFRLEVVRAYSCIQLNGRKAQPLFIEDVNLLDYADEYEWLTQSGMKKFMYPAVSALSTKRYPHYERVCKLAYVMHQKYNKLSQHLIKKGKARQIAYKLSQADEVVMNNTVNFPFGMIGEAAGLVRIDNGRIHAGALALTSPKPGRRYFPLKKNTTDGLMDAFYWTSHYSEVPHKSTMKCSYCD